MGITKKQKERERVPLPPYNSTQTSSRVSYKYNFLLLFVHRASSFFFSLIIFFLCALFCLLFYGWFTLIYFIKFSFNKEIKESGSSKPIVVEVCVSETVVIEEVKDEYCMENNTVLDDGEVQEKEIIEIEKMSEAHIEEKEDSGDGEGLIGVCVSQEVVTEEVCYDYFTGSNEGEVEEKEITEVEMRAATQIEDKEEEEAFHDEDLLNLELQDCREVSLMRSPPWWSLCGLLEVLLHRQDTK